MNLWIIGFVQKALLCFVEQRIQSFYFHILLSLPLPPPPFPLQVKLILMPRTSRSSLHRTWASSSWLRHFRSTITRDGKRSARDLLPRTEGLRISARFGLRGFSIDRCKMNRELDSQVSEKNSKGKKIKIKDQFETF